MIDTEVVRLRQLRGTALRARALAAAMESSDTRGNTVFSRSAVSCWRISRIVTGRLRGHPYLSYQRDASAIAATYYRLIARLTAIMSLRRGNSLQTFLTELMCVARELDNTRALTWSADLSDALGRLQTEIRRSLEEAGAGARNEAGTLSDMNAGAKSALAKSAGAKSAANAARNADASLETNWPYLAI